MKQCMVVIFINSLMSSDYDVLKELDNFKYIISKGAVIKKVTNQYPNLKAPVTTTVLTGVFPDSHGIYFNDFVSSSRRYREMQYEDIRVPTILDLFKENRNNVGLINWPVTEYGNFKRNFVYIKSTSFRNIAKGILRGSSLYMAKNIFKYSNVLKIGMQPEHDNFSSILAMELLERKKCNVIFMNFDHLEYVRKRYSVNSEHSTKALGSIDRRLGDLISWCKNKGILDSLSLCLVSGGGPYDCRFVVNINYALFKNDFIKLVKGKIKNYVAYAKCEGGSAFIYLKNPDSINDYGRVKVFLEDFVNKNSSYLKSVYDKNDENIYSNGFSFRIECRPNCVFSDGFNKNDLIEEFDLSFCDVNSKISRSFLGYSNEENSNGLFIAFGKGVNSGIEMDKCSIIDVAPTIASFMNLDFECSGGDIKAFKK